MVGGSGEAGAAIGNNCFDVMLLKQAGMAKELIRVDDYASDTIVLKLSSLNTIEKLIKLKTNDTGNKMVRMDLIFCIKLHSFSHFLISMLYVQKVTILSLMFMHMYLFAVNSPYAKPSERAFWHWCSTIFYT